LIRPENEGLDLLTPELITAIIGVGGLAAIIPKLIDGWSAWRSGRADAEKGKNQGVLERLADGEKRAEDEADFRRSLEEYAGVLRLMLIETGYLLDQLPPWPVRRSKSARSNGK
jgi:hypothetical protein